MGKSFTKNEKYELLQRKKKEKIAIRSMRQEKHNNKLIHWKEE